MPLSCCQNTCETPASKTAPNMIVFKLCFLGPNLVGHHLGTTGRPDHLAGHPKIPRGPAERKIPAASVATQSWWRPQSTWTWVRRGISSPLLERDRNQ